MPDEAWKSILNTLTTNQDMWKPAQIRHINCSCRAATLTPVDRLMDECRAVVAENHRQMMARQEEYWRTHAT